VPPPLDVAVTPGTDLADNTIATVTVTGLEPFEGAVLTQCPAGTSPSGRVCAVTVRERRRRRAHHHGDAPPRSIGPEGSPFDCASGTARASCRCSVRGAVPSRRRPARLRPQRAAVARTHRDRRPRHRPRAPAARHRHRERVPPQHLRERLRVHTRQQLWTSVNPRPSRPTDGDGKFETQLAVHRGLRISDGSVFDCTEPTGAT
jgi:hypothetical protein